MENELRRLSDEILRHREGIRDLPVVPRLSSDQVRARLVATYGGLEAPTTLATVLDDVVDLLRDGLVHITDPRYFGLFNPSVLPPGILADALVAAFNPQLAAWSHAPAANEIERYTLEVLGKLLGWQPDTLQAHFTSGGAEANLSAVLVALAARFPEHAQEGIAALPAPPRLYVSEEGHHSFDKIVRMAGLGSRALVKVPVDRRLRLDVERLRDRIRADRGSGTLPFLVVATAGSTGFGAIDPLPELADLAAAEGLWLHVDAAWGGGALLSPRLRPHLGGIERADSVTWDAHKWLSVPMGAGMFFCRHRLAVRRAFGVETPYMPDAEGARLDPYASTVQWSRRFIGLKVFMSLAEQGLAGYAGLIEHQTRMGEVLRSMLLERGWTVANETPLPLVCFTHPRIERGELPLEDVLGRVQERGDVWISRVRLPGGRETLRACITSYLTAEADLAYLVHVLEESARQG
jgi:glutamate/tyrosine decarboxylase-like PLP-dependent enzyme